MNNQSSKSKGPKRSLLPFQAKLVADVLAETVPARHLLVASAGTGKTHTAMSIVERVAAETPNHRILVISHRSLAAMYEYDIAQFAPNSRILIGSRSNLRELEASTKKGMTIWPAPAVVILGMDTARMEDVLNHLRSTQWDFVIIEDVHLYGRARWTLLKTILREPCFKRVLLMTRTPELKGLASLLKGVNRTEWILSELKDRDGKALFHPQTTKVELVTYERSDAETALSKIVLELTEALSSKPVGQFVRNTLLKRAASSPFALEQSVRRLRNALVHGSPHFLAAQEVKALSEVFDSDSSGTVSPAVWQNKAEAKLLLVKIIEGFESLTTDSKRKALEKLLDKLLQGGGSNAKHICVYCGAKATADYLKLGLTQRGDKAWLITGNQAPESRLTDLTGYLDQGGILVCTAVALQGIDLRKVQAFIHYDPPVSDSEMWVRISRSPGAVHYLLKEKSETLPKEFTVSESPSAIPKK